MFTTNLRSRLAHLTILGSLLALLAACGGGGPSASAPTAQPKEEATAEATARPRATAKPEKPTAAAETGDIKLVAATFAKKLGENQEPVDASDEFYPDETVYLSLEFEGRPKEGLVKSEFFWGDDSIAAAEVNFADVNSGVLISIGQSTFAGFNLSHEKPLPVSGNYRVESTLDGEPLGTYQFSVVPPEDALATNVSKVELAKGKDDDYNAVDPTTQFVPEDEVYVVGRGDFGKHSWLKIEWYVDGKLDDAGTQTLGPMDDNVEDTGFSFYYRPDGGWKEGDHEAVLYVNDEEVDRYGFSVGQAVAEEPTAAAVAGIEFGKLVEYSPESGLFTIKVPEDWEFSDNSNDVSANYAWTGPTGTAGIIVSLYENAETLSEEDLTTQGTEFVKKVFGSEPEFEIIETTTQSDGSVLVAWNATPDINGPVKLLGLTYIEQREDKVSLLNVLMPDEQNQELWQAGFKEIVNSYKIDPSVDIVK